MFPHELGLMDELLLRQSPKKWIICLDYPGFSSGIELQLVTVRLILSYDWLEFQRLETSCGWFYPAVDSSSGGWIRVAADSILQMTQVPATAYEFRLILSCGWLEFQRLDRSCRWFYPAADSSSGGWIRVVTDSINRPIRVPAAGYELWMIP